MPCQDISEVIELELDGDERVVHYALNKRTCGAEIGRASLVLDLVRGRPLATVADLTVHDLDATFEIAAPEEFLFAKHLAALQAAVATLVGNDTACTPVSVTHEGERLVFVALVSIDALTERIRACGGCGTCGRRKKSEKKAVPEVET